MLNGPMQEARWVRQSQTNRCVKGEVGTDRIVRSETSLSCLWPETPMHCTARPPLFLAAFSTSPLLLWSLTSSERDLIGKSYDGKQKMENWWWKWWFTFAFSWFIVLCCSPKHTVDTLTVFFKCCIDFSPTHCSSTILEKQLISPTEQLMPRLFRWMNCTTDKKGTLFVTARLQFQQQPPGAALLWSKWQQWRERERKLHADWSHLRAAAPPAGSSVSPSAAAALADSAAPGLYTERTHWEVHILQNIPWTAATHSHTHWSAPAQREHINTSHKEHTPHSSFSVCVRGNDL